MPYFSIIIPTYNRLSLLQQTLKSVLAQQFADFEVIVVDDGSTDETREWLAKQNGNVRVLTQKNRGTGVARNLGIKHASGRYAAFLDSDDVWFPWTLATYAQVIQNHDEPSFVTGLPFVFTSVDQLARAVPCKIRVESFPDYYASADAWRWFSASSFVIRRDRLKAVGGFHEEWGSEDADLAMMLGVEKSFVHIVAPQTFGYREHLESLKVMPTYLLSGGRLMLKKEKNRLYPGGHSRERNRIEILTRQVRPLSLTCLWRGMNREAWELYGATFRWHVSLGRWKYLVAFPLKALLTRI
jgi:glycosyltransferase involved in cell wall biosynthesis